MVDNLNHIFSSSLRKDSGFLNFLVGFSERDFIISFTNLGLYFPSLSLPIMLIIKERKSLISRFNSWIEERDFIDVVGISISYHTQGFLQGKLSVVSYQLSVISRQPSAISRQPSATES